MQPTIIIFDDDQDMLELFALICRKTANVRTATDPWLFLDENSLAGISLIIIDVNFGSKSSLNLIKDLKKPGGLAQFPVVLHSGHECLEWMAAQAGVDGFLKKPASIQAIRACVQHHLASAEISNLRTL